MGFSFKRKESVVKAIPRLGCERIDRALECLTDVSKPEAIHNARKEIKKARAILRLARPNISKKERRSITKRLREASAYLARPRDAAVKAMTLRELARQFKSELASDAFREMRVELRRDCDDAVRGFIANQNANAVERILTRARKAFAKLTIDAKEWDAIEPGVKKTYRNCRRDYARTLKNPTSESLHEWRKHVKNLWYQMLLLEPIWPEQMNRMACELEAVGDCLGDDHDLFVLRQSLLGRRSHNGDKREMKLLETLIAERQQELRAKALAMGKYFYAEKPSAFCKRLCDYWRAWRKEINSKSPARRSRNQ